jgi:hypothetical protein
MTDTAPAATLRAAADKIRADLDRAPCKGDRRAVDSAMLADLLETEAQREKPGAHALTVAQAILAQQSEADRG